MLLLTPPQHLNRNTGPCAPSEGCTETVPKTHPHHSKMQSILLVNYVQEILDIHSNIRQVTTTKSNSKNRTDSPL